MYRGTQVSLNQYQIIASSAGWSAYFVSVLESSIREQVVSSVSSLPLLIHAFSANHLPAIIFSSLSQYVFQSSILDIMTSLQLLFEVYRPLLILTHAHPNVLEYLQQRKTMPSHQVTVNKEFYGIMNSVPHFPFHLIFVTPRNAFI